MLIKSQTIPHIRNDAEWQLQNVSEIVVTNFGTSTAYVNGRKIKPGFTIGFMRSIFTDTFNLKVWFENDGTQENNLEISYLIQLR